MKIKILGKRKTCCWGWWKYGKNCKHSRLVSASVDVSYCGWNENYISHFVSYTGKWRKESK